MAFQVSPGVNVSEIDLTASVQNVSTTIGALAGQFRWGPLNSIILVSSEKELVARFAKPDNSTANAFFTAANFLDYGNALKVVRVADETAAKNSTADGTGLLIKNDDHYDASFSAGQGAVGQWAGKFPGTLGNGLKVSVCHKNGFSQAMTVSSSGTALTGTNFDTKLAVGSIIRSSGGEERSIVSVTNATTAVLSSAFTSNLASNAATALWEFYKEFSAAPGTSAFAASKSSANDEVHVIVVDATGQWTGVNGQVLEKFGFVSLASDAKTEENVTNYYPSVIAQKSKFVRWMDHATAGTNWGSAANSTTFTDVPQPQTFTLTGGLNGSAVTASDLQRGYALFIPQTEDISIILGAGADATVATYLINSIAEVRKDCVVCLSPLQANVVGANGAELTNVVAFRNSLPSSSYAILDSGWKKQLDRYNDVYRWVPLNGDIGGLIVRTDTTRDPWFPPAGLQRGSIKNAIQLAYNPSEADRDELFKVGVNPVIAKPGSGVVLWGDKTLLSRPSAFDAINVRRLFIVLEKAIKRTSESFLFELNDEFTRAQFKNLVDPFLRDVKGRRGIYDFYVECSEQNNTAEVIDRNELVCDIFIKPTRSIRYIQLNFVATRSGAAFSEVIGSV